MPLLPRRADGRGGPDGLTTALVAVGIVALIVAGIEFGSWLLVLLIFAGPAEVVASRVIRAKWDDFRGL